jgi:hypothetical protein
MTRKKHRKRLAKALRGQGFTFAVAHSLAKVIVRAGHPLEVTAAAYAPFGVEIFPGHFCGERAKHYPTTVGGPGGENVGAAFAASVA